MWKSETATERLMNIIHTIKLEQKTGVLTARRGEKSTLEEGTIVFVNGQMTSATLGHRSDLAALNRLSTWGQCRYVFLPSVPHTIEQTMPAASSILEQATGVDVRPAIRPPHVPEKNIEGVPQTPLLPASSTSEKMPVEDNVSAHPRQPLQEGLRLIDQFQFSRTHKRLFLLVDGQRSLADFMHLMGKNGNEIHALLRDLQSLGAIYLGDN